MVYSKYFIDKIFLTQNICEVLNYALIIGAWDTGIKNFALYDFRTKILC